jgi:hypothetical protein
MNDREILAIKEQNRYKILKYFYDLYTNNPPNSIFDLDKIRRCFARENEMSDDIFDLEYRYLTQKNLLEGMTFSHSTITQYGVDEIESLIKNPDKSTNHFSSELIKLVINNHVMGDQITNNSNISDNTGNISIGKFNDVANTVNENAIGDFTQALLALKEAVVNSQDLSDDQIQENVEVINSLSDESIKPKPNKILMKALQSGLVNTLKTVPDVAKAITAIAPFFSS